VDHAAPPPTVSHEPVGALPSASEHRVAPRRDRARVAIIAAAVAAALVIAIVGWWVPAAQAPIANSPVAASAPQPVARRLSIVVLPFTDLSEDRGQQYFTDGITDDLTTDLSRLRNVLVISRNTAFTYKDQRVDAKQIGRELAVRYVLEGSARPA